jgi:hypothetical protein
VLVHTVDKARGTCASDNRVSPAGLTIYESSPNHLVWTGADLFLWSAFCGATGVGGFYQPAAP